VAHDIERSLRRGESLDNPETGLVHCAFGLLGVFKGHANLVAELRTLVLLQDLFRLGKVVLDKVKELVVIFVCDARVVQDESTVDDQRIGSLGITIRRASRELSTR
jgi:hypothetical protein